MKQSRESRCSALFTPEMLIIVIKQELSFKEYDNGPQDETTGSTIM